MKEVIYIPLRDHTFKSNTWASCDQIKGSYQTRGYLKMQCDIVVELKFILKNNKIRDQLIKVRGYLKMFS